MGPYQRTPFLKLRLGYILDTSFLVGFVGDFLRRFGKHLRYPFPNEHE